MIELEVIYGAAFRTPTSEQNDRALLAFFVTTRHVLTHVFFVRAHQLSIPCSAFELRTY